MTSLNSILNNFYLVLTGPIIIITMVIFAWFRAGTIISLLERLWRLIVGKVEVTDQKLIKFNKQMRDIEQFNFVYGLKVKSIEQMHQVIEWIGENKLGFIDVISAKKWIDTHSMNIQLPPRGYIWWRFVGFLLCGVLLALSSIALGSNSVLVQFKTSKTWFLLDQSKAQGLIGDWILEVKQCDGLESNKLLVTTKLTEIENQLICESFKEKSFVEYLDKTLHSQRLLSGFIFCVFLMWMVVIVMQTQSYHAAKRIKDSLN
ncbi:MAG: DUF6216 family protein [Methylotenera sp.]|uniref:DUF6216 family protein n=1 Tax=Methylotenera sp. TaxID=2051956 RepID=UPI00272510C2|nr:DUF6216 family protein [Methylotenera sp.]MDO9150952.1 DUF6216 family protein [Methylotenera sp.]